MLDIYVCEDNKIQLELISKYVSNTILIEQLELFLKKKQWRGRMNN